MNRYLRALLPLLGLLTASVVGTTLHGVASATGVVTVIVCPTSGWDHSDSKPFNSEVVAAQYTDDGLRIQVDGPSQKQSGYVTLAQPVALVDVNQADVQLTYQKDHGYAPAYQLTTFTDASLTTWSGNLVYEDGRWWATRPQHWPLVPTAAQAQGGATFEQWKAAYPGATIYRVGFSLGSGAAASAGVVKNVTFQGKMWVFKRTCPTPTSATSTTTTTTTTSTTKTSSSTPSSTTSSTSGSVTSRPTSIGSTATSSPSTTTSRSSSVTTTRPPSTSSRPAVVASGDLADTGSGGLAATAALVAGVALVVGLVCLLIAARRRRDRTDAS